MFSWCANNNELTAVFLSMLAAQGVRVLARLTPSTALVEYQGNWWTIHDNGGELNVEKVNWPGTLRSIGYTSTSFQMDTMTMAYRVLAAMRGEPVDWRWCANAGLPIYVMLGA